MDLSDQERDGRQQVGMIGPERFKALILFYKTMTPT